ncbi:MAG: NAD(P)H-dependent glycerol-3-phosphate dehydrogenase [Candidatus Cloacimonadaceae bacterium]|jgi:glycerol-3-phosphate dehydrogenase (NAD(P)+)|nr:NAD(P)-dependent glycerol-3-phosphate dehydrogenase [Candidatus Cloacimonadota bacterium]MDY0127814.1 NAD(P)H-dependent glycerol-3-phosphate dehydrogenase [Candidatus Cloacimonadaceae bacterium]MCB5254860.1 NAD(P)-dependent glycerol-3-phosphate dehydrogenase [Candidatus Cloacimonadota bacterium]MCK9177917.1 NAD(P)-dependent glycerol-3-phosphate dehydrogenase [Candidatus Cloacimonadota bacterium]MCK9242335.1 NAD(P)-dependent glycerol-3-phosphate dehydrogenase [Candidatus Cloacimonadota bacter
MRISIIGGGGWGLALAKLLAENQHDVLVWEYNPDFLDSLNQYRSNPVLLKDIVLPDTVSFTDSFATVAEHRSDLILLATPSQFVRSTLRNIQPSVAEKIWLSPKLKAILNVAKGIEQNTLKTIDKILEEELPPAVHDKICVLSGPSHAEEVAKGLPTTVVIAGSDEKLLIILQAVFSNQYFRAYRSLDITGVEIGGAVKNIIAIAAGIVSGLGFGDNTMGALLTRGIVEISRLGETMQAWPETFLGLSGIGDLITTAISPHSRNRSVGFQIGQGKSLSEIQSSMKMVAEGVETTRSVYQLAQKLNIDMPIVSQVYEILYNGKDPHLAMRDLMLRELKAEF